MGLEFNSDKQYIKSTEPKIIGSDSFVIRSGQGSDEKEVFRALLDAETKLPRIGVNRTGNRVDTITVTSQGSGYTAPPRVIIDAPPAGIGAIQATASAILSNGRVIAITVSNPGAGYTSAPSITIENAENDTTGAGAAATCSLDTIDYEIDVNGAIRTSSSIISDTARILNLDLENFVTADADFRAPYLKLFDNKSEQVWVPNVSLAKGQIRYFEGNVYRANNTGITGSNPPLHTDGVVRNGTVDLEHVGFRVDDPNQPHYEQLSWPRSITPPLGDNSNKIATTEYVLNLATNDVGGRIYVSQQIGDDENDGRSVASPVRTIKRGCQIATESKNVKETVVIAGGDYLEDNPISIPPDCSVIGDSLRIVIVRPNNPGKHVFKFADKNYISGLVFRDKLDTAGNPVSTWNFACVFDDKQRLYYDSSYGGDFKRRFPIGHQIFGKALFRAVFDFNAGGNLLTVGETINGVNTSAIGSINVVDFDTTTGPTAYQKGTIDFETSVGVFAEGESVRYFIEAPVEYTGWPSSPSIGDPFTHPNDGITYTWNGSNWAREFTFTIVELSSIRAEGEVVDTGTDITSTLPIIRIDGSKQAEVGGIIFYTNELQGVDNIHDFHEGQEVFISGLPEELANLNGVQRIYDLDKVGVLIDDDSRSRRFVIPKDNMPDFTDSNFVPSNATVSSFSYYVTVSLLNSPNRFEETPYISRRYQDARNLIKNNLEFIKDETYRQIIAEFPEFTNPNEAKCRRDIGHFVSAIVRDMEFGGNHNTIEAAKYYVIGTGIGYIATELSETIRAFDIARNLAVLAMRGWRINQAGDLYAPQFSNISRYFDPDVTIDPVWPYCANVEAAINNLANLFIAIISNNQTDRFVEASYLIARNQEFIKQETSRYIEDAYPELFISPNASAARYKDSTNLIRANREEILDRALAEVAIEHPDFYYPGDTQTNAQSRYNDAYRLIQKNKETIIDTAAAEIAVQYPDFYYPGDLQTNERSRYADAYRLIQQNKTAIIDTAYTASGGSIPADPDGTKCKRDIGFFIDAISLDVFLGGNSNTINFLKQYFDGNGNLTSNGLAGEISQSVLAFNSARDEMRKAVANQLGVTDSSVTAGSAIYASGGTTVPNTDPTACSDVQTYISNLSAIVTTRLNAGNLTGLPNVNRDYQSRYFDAANLIKANKEEIKVRAAAQIAIEFPDFYYPNDPQTTARSRFKDGYRLIQQNRQEIIDRAAAQIAVDYPDFYYPGDAQTNARSRFKDGYRLIQKNRTQIIDNAFASMQAQYPGFTVPGGDITKCKRDIGYFVDAISLDMATGGNQYSIAFTKLYFDANGFAISNGLVGETAQSVFAFNEATEQCRLAVTNQLAYNDLSVTAGPVNYGGGGGNVSNTDPAACSDVQSALQTLTTLITDRITAGNINGANALPTPTTGDGFVTAGEAKCKRDIGFFIDAISLDIYDGGNQFTVGFTKQYFNPETGVKIANGLSGEESEADTAFTTAVDMMKKAVTNQLYIKDLTLTAGPATYGAVGPNIANLQSGNAAACVDVQTAIETLATVAQSRLLAGNINGANALPTITTGASVTPAGEAKCRRDIGFIVDAVAYDLQTGGNSRIIDYTLRYFENATTLLSNGLAGEISQSVVAFNKARDWMNKALTNQLYVKDTTITADPATLSNISESSCANVRTAVNNLIAILTTTLQAGNTSGLPAVRKASGNLKCRRDIGYFVDAVSLDLFTGSNKYSRKFVLQYFNNGSPISDGLIGEEAQSVVAFNKARDMMKLAVYNGLYYKDLTVSTGPANYGGGGGNVSNTSSTACSDVQTAIANSTTIITDRITAGNITGLPAETATTYFAGESKCRRDIGFIVDAVASDLYDGGNKNTIRATKRYFITNTLPLANGLVGETSQSITAFNKARDMMRLAVTNQLYAKDLTITGDPNPGYLPTEFGYGTPGELNNNNNPDSCIDVRNSIGTLIAIATTAIAAGNLNSLPAVNEGDFLTTTTVKCRRDIAFILGALRRDLILGGNAGMVTAGESYYTGNALTGIPQSELQPTREAFTKARDLAILAMRSWKGGDGTGSVYTPQFATAPQFIDPTVIVDTNTPVCNNVATAITTSFNILDSILADGTVFEKTFGTLFTPTIVYPENVIYDADNKRVNVDAAYLDLPFIEASPYIQNASVISFLGGGGCEIDGDKVRQPNCPRPGLNPPIGNNPPKATYPNQGKSMVAAQFTIISFGGTGYKIVNDGYTQLVSVFVLFAQDGVYADTGGYASITNSATNFGTYALRARGYRKEPYSFDIGTITNVTTTATGRTVFTVGGLGREPLEHYIVKFADYENQDPEIEYFIDGVRQTTVGPPFTSTIDLNEAILIKRKSDGQPVTVGNAELVGKQVRLHRPSIVNSSSHTWEYAGAGNDYNALPENGGVKNEALEQVSQAYGRVYTSGTDELGDFKVGYFAKIENRTGNITFTGTVSISEVEFLKLKGGDVVVTGFDASNTLGGNFASDSKIPTQKAVKDYISNNLGQYLNKPYSTNAVPRNLVELTDSGKISLDQIPALRPFNVFTIANTAERLALEGPLAGDIAIETETTTSYILNNDLESQYLGISVNTNLEFATGTFVTGSISTGQGEITEYRQGVLYTINITNQGNGYDDLNPPSISISAPDQPGGVSAQATCTVVNGRVVTVKIVDYNGYNGGFGYTSPPSITFASPGVGGTQAEAVGLIESRIYIDIVNNIKIADTDTIQSTNVTPLTVPVIRTVNTSGSNPNNWVSLSTSSISAQDITSGIISSSRLAGNAGEANSFSFLRGDSSYAPAVQSIKAAEERYFDFTTDQTAANQNTLQFRLNNNILVGHLVVAPGIPTGTTVANTFVTIVNNVSFTVVTLSTSVTQLITQNTIIEFIRPESPVLLDSSFTLGNFVDKVLVSAGGTGFTDGQYFDLALSGGTGSGLKANITVQGGSITNVLVTSGGSGYSADFSITQMPSQIGLGANAVLEAKRNTSVKNFANVGIDIKRVDAKTLEANEYGNTGVARFKKSQFKIGEAGDGSVELKVGTGSGLDADLLDGQQGLWYRDGQNLINLSISPDKLGSGLYGIDISGQSANTLRLTTSVNNPSSSPSPSTFNEGIVADTRNNTADGLADGGVRHGVITFRQFGTGTDASGGGVRQLAFTDNNNLWIRGSGSGVSTFSTWAKVWTSINDGVGTGMDADLLDGRQGTFYQNGYNINSGIIGPAHISSYLGSTSVNNSLTVKSYTAQTFYDVYISGKILSEAPFVSGLTIDLFDNIGIKVGDFELLNVTTSNNIDDTLDYTILSGRLLSGNIAAAFRIGNTQSNEIINDYNISDFAGTFNVASLESVSGTARLNLGRTDGTASVPVIDFRTSSSPAGLYNVRLAASGGNSANGSGTLNVIAANANAFTLNSNVIWNAGNITFSSLNNASTAVQRDSSGNFSAGTITASLTGAASLNVLKSGDTMSGDLTLLAGNKVVINTASGDQGSGSGNKCLTIVNDTVGRDAFITFHVSGDYAGYFGLDGSTNDLFWGGWSVGTSTKHTILHTGNNPVNSLNVSNTLVKRDANGNFSAGTITATLSGNASSATQLQTARNINGVSFNGTADITITASTSAALSLGTYLSYDSGTTFNGGTARTINISASTSGTSNIVARDSSGNFSAGTITATLTGNASSATTASNLALGAAGSIPYQTGSNTTVFLARGTAGQYLRQAGSAPEWVNFPVAGASGQIQYHDGGSPAGLGASAQLTYSSNVLRLGNTSSYRHTNVPSWTGDAANGEGKLEYHSNRWYINAGGDSSEVVRFRRGGSDVAWIDNSGNFSTIGDITAFASSDRRLKTNIELIDNALDKVTQISGVKYNWNELAEGKDTEKREAGVIAQEIKEFLPEAVVERDNGYLAVQYERLVPLLIEAIKELKQEVETLKNK